MIESYDRVFETLSNEQRRRILFALLSEPLDLDSPPDGFESGEIAVLERHHVHLPKLVDCGFVRWGPGAGVVEEGPQFEEIEPLLELLAEHQPRLAVSRDR